MSRTSVLFTVDAILVAAFVFSVSGLPNEEGNSRSQASSSPLGSVFGDSEEDFKVVHPIRLDHDGSFLTHDVRYVSPLHDAKASSRKKRHVDVGRFSRRGARLLYSVPFDGEIITVNLTENDGLLREGFVIERIKSGNTSSGAGITSSLSGGTQWPCHFRGHVEGQPGSRVALSTCHGLTGLLITEKGDYFIEPMKVPKLNDPEPKAQPHKIYRRDLSSVIDRAEPLLHMKEVARPEKQRHSRQQRNHKNHSAKRKSKGSRQTEESIHAPFPFFDQQDDFCGVVDTKRKYRRFIKKREQWEEKRARAQGAGWNVRKGASGGRRSRRTDILRRRKRSVSVERMIEMLVVVDKKMVDYYEVYDGGSVERYVLTIINIVSELFHDASIGNSLHVSLVRLILLEEEEKGLKISQHAEKTLDSFCKWAKRINPKGDEHPNHHDVAILLTRRDICSNSNKSCETLGLAHVAGMCQSHRSCNVNQDTGLSLAYTVAHELGHNFAMHHDGQMNDCKSSAKYNHVMAPHLTSSSLPMRWSSCSRRYITRFLDRNWGFCLNDDPAPHDFDIPTSLPGELYDADHQCRLMFGDKSRHCYGIDDVCDRLWCFAGGTCRSRLHAAAAGTNCGKGKWCFGGKCVPVGKRPKAIDGGWGDWTGWSSCSRTCGIGVSYSMRHCDSPAPRNGGKYCLGERKRYRTCSKWKCQKDKNPSTFRAQQCAAFNNVKYKNMTFNWKPVDSPLYPCELHCYTRAGKIPFADRLRDKVIDGTKCFPGSDDICVDGICRRVGCDKNIGSRALEDRCGVCHGDGSSCFEVKKIFNKKKGEEYTDVGLIPRGARNILVGEMAPSSNFLALRNATNKTHFYLNGNYIIQWDTKFQLAGTQFTYGRLNETTDNITAPGPLLHDIMVMVLFVEENPGISITYTMPYNVTESLSREEEFPEFKWKIQDWNKCSRECGKGEQVAAAVCVEKRAGIVEDFFCNATLRPNDKRRPCNDVPCPPRWWAAPWQPCSVTCGGGEGVQHRIVMCVRSVGEDEQISLSHDECADIVRPVNKKRCSLKTEIPCPAWRAEEWQQCSATCGGGTANRTVRCVTYVMNEVINLSILDSDGFDEFDIPGKKKVKPPRINALIPGLRSVNYPKVKNPSLEDEEVLNAKGKLLSIEAEAIEQDIDPDLDAYDVEDDAKCDVTTKPLTHKPCNIHTCSIVISTIPETEEPTEISTEEFMTTIINSGEFGTGNDHTRLPATTLQNSTAPEINNVSSTSRRKSNSIKSDGTDEKDGDSDPEDDITPDPEPGTFSFDYNFDVGTDSDKPTIPEEDFDLLPVEPDLEKKEMEDKNDDFDITIEDFIPKSPLTTTEATSRSTSDESRKTTESTKRSQTDKTSIIATTLKEGDVPDSTPVSKPGTPDKDFDVFVVREDEPEVEVIVTEVPKSTVETPKADEFDEKKKEWGLKSTPEAPEIVPVSTTQKPLTTTSQTPRPHSTLRPDAPSSAPSPTTEPVQPTTEVQAEWVVGNWSKCSTTCGVGAMFRRVECSAGETSQCNSTLRPPPALICNLGPCAKWVYGEWTKCTRLCGAGTRSKKTECVDERTEKVLRPHQCSSMTPLDPITISCREYKCMPWKTSRWTTCSTQCGPGIQRRRTACSRGNQCDSSLRPHERKSCFIKKCVEWRPFEWSKCSVHCGGGLQRRGVVCVEQDSGRTTNASDCNPVLIPKKVQKCNLHQCPASDYDFTSCQKNRLSDTFCRLLEKLGRCVQPSLAIQCCVTCKTYISVRHKDKIS